MNERYYISQEYMTSGLDNPYNLFKLLFTALLVIILSFILIEFSFMDKQNYTMKLDSINIPYQGERTYTLIHNSDVIIWNECIDAMPGERVLFVDYRGIVTKKVWKTEVHDNFKCKQGD